MLSLKFSRRTVDSNSVLMASLPEIFSLQYINLIFVRIDIIGKTKLKLRQYLFSSPLLPYLAWRGGVGHDGPKNVFDHCA